MALVREPEDVKLPEEVEGTEEPATRSGVPLVTLSATVKRTAPILAESNVALWTDNDEVNVEVMHRETMRKFKAQLKAEDLEKCGFHPRDTAEDCVQLIVDVLSADDSDTVVVTPMAAPAEGSETAIADAKVPFFQCKSLRILFSVKMRTNLYEYSFVALEQKLDAATRTQLQLQSLKQKIKAQSQQMELQKTEIGEVKAAMEEKIEMMKASMNDSIKEAIKAQTTAEIDTVINERIDAVKAAMEEKSDTVKAAMNEAMEEKMKMIKEAIKAQTKAEIETVKAAMEAMKAQSKKEMDAMKVAIEESEEKSREIAALKSKGIASFRSSQLVGRYRKWNTVELAPTLDEMGALSEDQSEFRIGIEGVYRVLTAVNIGGEMHIGYADLYINGAWKCRSHGGKHTSPVLSFVGRLRVGDTVKVRISGNEYNDNRYNWLQIEKL